MHVREQPLFRRRRRVRVGKRERPPGARVIGYLEADRRFHLSLLALSGNDRLVETVGDLRKRSRLYGLTDWRPQRSAAQTLEDIARWVRDNEALVVSALSDS